MVFSFSSWSSWWVVVVRVGRGRGRICRGRYGRTVVGHNKSSVGFLWGFMIKVSRVQGRSGFRI